MRSIATVLLLSAMAAPASAGDLVVNVTGIRSADGEVGCALHSSPAQFPTGNAGVPIRWQKADPNGVACRFAGLRAGAYAVAVSLDLNGNRKTDTNIVGLPTEDWGVTNNVRRRLRAPTFEEAQVMVPESGTTTVTVRLGR